VDYINSSGIALVIQLLIEASNSAQKIYAFGLSRALLPRCSPWWGLPSMPGLFAGQAEALAALVDGGHQSSNGSVLEAASL